MPAACRDFRSDRSRRSSDLNAGEMPLLAALSCWRAACSAKLHSVVFLLLTLFAQNQGSFLGKREEDSEHILHLMAPGICQGMKAPERQNQNINRQKGEGSQGREMGKEVLTKGNTNIIGSIRTGKVTWLLLRHRNGEWQRHEELRSVFKGLKYQDFHTLFSLCVK